MALYVQFGCGPSCPEKWQNFDASPTLRMQRIPLLGLIAPGPRFPRRARVGDIVRGLPLADNSADGAYCSHVIEHLAMNDVARAIANVFRILKPGGVFRLVQPDLRIQAEGYLNSKDPMAAKEFVFLTGFGKENQDRSFKSLLHSWLGNSAHLWMWDYESLSAELAKAGFTRIRRAKMGDHPDPMFALVEDEVRWNGQLGIHCEKP